IGPPSTLLDSPLHRPRQSERRAPRALTVPTTYTINFHQCNTRVKAAPGCLDRSPPRPLEICSHIARPIRNLFYCPSLSPLPIARRYHTPPPPFIAHRYIPFYHPTPAVIILLPHCLSPTTISALVRCHRSGVDVTAVLFSVLRGARFPNLITRSISFACSTRSRISHLLLRQL